MFRPAGELSHCGRAREGTCRQATVHRFIEASPTSDQSSKSWGSPNESDMLREHSKKALHLTSSCHLEHFPRPRQGVLLNVHHPVLFADASARHHPIVTGPEALHQRLQLPVPVTERSRTRDCRRWSGVMSGNMWCSTSLRAPTRNFRKAW